MHIAIDARAIEWTGIGRYIKNLLLHITRLRSSHRFTILVPRGQKPDIARDLRLPASQCTYREVEPSYYSWREQFILARELAGISADLFHFTHFNVPLVFNRPYVVTIHDVTRFIFPGQKRQRLLEQIAYELVFSRTVSKARALICVSEATRQDLQRLAMKTPRQKHVIHEGVEMSFRHPISTLDRQKIRLLLGTHSPYLLSVGVWMSHKNLVRLLAAFATVRDRFPDLKLVITGKPVPGYVNLLRTAEKMKLPEAVLFPGFVDQALLPALYAEAKAFVFPSLYEGFGLPALEAAASGTPVITSAVSSLPEVMGDGALYINPEYTEGIARAITSLITNEAQQRALIKKGKRRAALFTWEECARQTLQAYEAAI